MSRITAAIWITSISTRSNMVMSRGWPIGRIPPSIAMWRAASIHRIGAGRWMGSWGDWSNPLKGLFRCKRPITRTSYAIVRLRFANRTYGPTPPSIVTWRAASIHRIGAARWMGRWGDWSKTLNVMLSLMIKETIV